MILFCLPLMGQNQQVFEMANTAYNQGNYQEAVDNYEKILESGETSATLYYNLGNSYYKLNNVASSIYYYEKALQLDPGNEDVLNNLSFAQNMAMDDIKEIPKTGVSRFMNSFLSVLSFNGWAWMAVLTAFLFAISFLVYYFSAATKYKRLFFTFAISFFVISLFSLGIAFQQYQLIQNSEFAIVFAEEAPVRSEPNVRGDELFLLHEGTKIEIKETFQDWIKLELANGAEGWIEKEEVRLL